MDCFTVVDLKVLSQVSMNEVKEREVIYLIDKLIFFVSYQFDVVPERIPNLSSEICS